MILCVEALSSCREKKEKRERKAAAAAAAAAAADEEQAAAATSAASPVPEAPAWDKPLVPRVIKTLAEIQLEEKQKVDNIVWRYPRANGTA